MAASWFQSTGRLENWRVQLNKTLTEWADREFVWGESDCFCFAGACVEAQTGQNPMKGFIGSYSTKREAYYKILNGLTGTDGEFYKAEGIEGCISMLMGAPKVPGMAQRGDVVLIKDGNTQITSIVDDSGRRLVAMTEKDGLVRLPLSMGKVAWSV